MDEAGLSLKLGRLLRAERERRGWTQEGLASRAGVTSQQVSVFEAGKRQPTTRLTEAMFRAFGLQLRVDLEQLDAELDKDIERAMSGSAKERDWLLSHLNFLCTFAKDPPRMIIDGPLAANLLGVPIIPKRIDLMIAESDVDALAGWLSRFLNVIRYDERTKQFTKYDIDPRRPGMWRWATVSHELAVVPAPVLPEPVVVRVEERELEVRPLLDVTADHPDVARVVERCRKRSLH